MPSRAFYTIVSSDLAKSRDWYLTLFDYRVEFDSDWFVHLQAVATPAIELGILARDHEIAPPRARLAPTGGMLTIVVDNVDQVHQQALANTVEVLEPPMNLFYGQRRMLLVDPSGLIVDVSSECPPDPGWLASINHD